MKIVCLGDSLTRGYGVAAKDSWVHLANVRLDAEVLCRGVTGDTSGGMLSRFEREVLAQRPDIVFIMGGGNDLRAGCPPAIPQSNLMSMCHQSQANGIFPVVGLIMPSDTAHLAPQWAAFPGNYIDDSVIKEYRRWLIQYCDVFSIPVVDFLPPFLAGFKEDEKSTFYVDGLHPNEKGHQILADTFCRRMVEITADWQSPVRLRYKIFSHIHRTASGMPSLGVVAAKTV